MSASVIPGHCYWSLTRDSEGHRDYVLRHKVRTTDKLDGPNTVLNASGLPIIGSMWNFGNDLDIWAFCYPDAKANLLQDDPGGGTVWLVEQKFSTRPLKRCQDFEIEDPLLEPQKVSGSFTKYVKDPKFDRFGNPILTSSFEQVMGLQFDANRPCVHIEQNVADLQLATVTPMVDTLNDAPLWGLPARRIKLSNFAWERRYNGGCNVYYSRLFDFEIRMRSDDLWDELVPDRGTMVLRGHHATQAEILGTGDPDGDRWVLDPINGVMPDSNNPQDFIRYKDRNGELAPITLNGHGQPYVAGLGTGSADDNTILIEYYPESNFLLLGIPTSF